MGKQATRSARYSRGDDDDTEDDGSAALYEAQSGPPAVCMVFELKDNDDFEKEVNLEKAKQQRALMLQKLRKLKLTVREQANKERTKLFLRISAEDLYPEEAEMRKIRVPLKAEHGGGMCPFTRDLHREKAFAPAADEQSDTCFTSLQQLEMTDQIIRRVPREDFNNEPIKPEKLMEDRVLAANGYFYMHDEVFQLRLQNLYCWCDFAAPQPLDQIRIYFGEKIALFFTFMGFFVSMLWIPAILGMLLFFSQLYTMSLTGAADSPFQFLYAVLVSLWAVVFPLLWRRLEDSKKYEWDTIHFEDEEKELEEYRLHPATLKDVVNPDDPEEIIPYSYDEGEFFPFPTGRCAQVAKTLVFIVMLDATSVLLTVVVWKYIALPMMSPGDTLQGSIVCAVLLGLQSEALTLLFDAAIPVLIRNENWRTQTDKEDATILRSCSFRLVNLYFGVIFVSFLVNRVSFFGDIKCPLWQCMPVVQVVLALSFALHCLFRLLRENVIPYVVRKYNASVTPLHSKVLPMEEQQQALRFAGVIDLFGNLVFHFGFVALFSVAFPLVPALSLLMGLINLRSLASNLLTTTQRPPYQCASDIGTWQVVLTILSTMAVITNTCLVGLTSRSIYFFYPSMSMVGRVWFIAIMEHALFLAKVLLDNTIYPEDLNGRKAYQDKQDQMKKWLDEVEEHKDD